MAAKKTDSFFIRHTTNIDNDAAFHQGEIDLGAFVDALGEAALRVHNIAVVLSDVNGNALSISGGQDSAAAQFQLTTQSQADTVLASDKSVIATGIIYATSWDQASTEYPLVSHDMDQLPQLWTNGYLVAVDSIYLGGEASTGWDGDVYCTVTLECTSERMTKAAGIALALSQQ